MTTMATLTVYLLAIAALIGALVVVQRRLLDVVRSGKAIVAEVSTIKKVQ